MALKLITPPATEPVTIAEVEGQCKLDVGQISGDEFELAAVQGYITAVRQKVENILRRALVTQTWELIVDGFPTPTTGNPFAAIELPLPPLQSVVSVQYLATDGILTTLDPSTYVVDADTTPGRILPAYGTTWPATRDFPGAVRFRFVAGYGPIIPEVPEDGVAYPDNVPQCIKNWMRMNIASLYENRESQTVASGRLMEVDLSNLADSLLDPERWELRI